MCQKTSVVRISVTNGDEVLFVNSLPVMTSEASSGDPSTGSVAKALAAALGVELLEVSLPTPSRSDWTWSDVWDAYEGRS